MEKTILITGATSGIGNAIAKYLSKEGYGLVLVARDKEKLTLMQGELTGVRLVISYDLSETTEIKSIFDACQNDNIVFDGLVHCAGMGMDRVVRMCETEHLEKLMRIHYYAFVELCRQFVKKKNSNVYASIVALSSISPVVSAKGSLPYSSAKAAMDNAVDVMAKEFVKRKIRVNSLQPALVNTPMTQNAEDVIEIEKVQPLGYIEPEYIAFLIEFLLSDKAKYITGSHIPVTAGMET